MSRTGQPRPAGSTLGRLTQTIVDQIGTAIVTGQFAPATLLPIEAEMCTRYGASRSVLREAMKILNAKGLVTARPRLGTSITTPDRWNLFDPDILRWMLRSDFSLPLLIEFTNVRMGIEPMAAELAALNADSDAIAQVAEGYRRMEAADRGEDDPLTADISFHVALLEASGNRFLQRLKPLVETALKISIRYTDSIARDESEKLAAHSAVLDRLIARDPAGAASATRQLLADTRHLMATGRQD